MSIINLTQHKATFSQQSVGVVDLCDAEGKPDPELVSLLNFDTLPSAEEVIQRAEALAQLASDCFATAAMIGGAPYLMAPLEAALRAKGIRPLYAFSERTSVEETLPDGSVRKTAVFIHKGFVGEV